MQDGKGEGLSRGACFAQLSLPFLNRMLSPNALEDILHNNAVKILNL